MLRSLCCIVWLIVLAPAYGQMPRNTAGRFEYSHTITLSAGQGNDLQTRARSFFRLPFLVHWDSVEATPLQTGLLIKGKGTIDVRVYHRMKRRVIPIALDFDVLTEGNSYQYTIHHFEARRRRSDPLFPLEEPGELSPGLYDKMIDRTHRYMTVVIGYLKRELSGDDDTVSR